MKLTYLSIMETFCLKNKYTKWYKNIIMSAQLRAQSRKEAQLLFSYVEGHHILPKSLCETKEQIKDLKNIVFLSAREHFICHLLLCKMFASNIKYKMYRAVTKFLQSNTSQNRILTSRQYDNLRRLVSISNTFIHTGRKRAPLTDQQKKNISEGLKKSKKFQDKMKNRGYSHSIETKEKLKTKWNNIERREKFSKKMKQTRASNPEAFAFFGEKNPMWGKKWDENHLSLFREKSTGKNNPRALMWRLVNKITKEEIILNVDEIKTLQTKIEDLKSRGTGAAIRNYDSKKTIWFLESIE